MALSLTSGKMGQDFRMEALTARAEPEIDICCYIGIINPPTRK